MYCHSPKEKSFVYRNKLPSAWKVWHDLLEVSGIEDYDTYQEDRKYAVDPKGARVWDGGETDYFNEQLDLRGDRRVSGYYEGFKRLLRARSIEFWTDLPQLVHDVAAGVPGLSRLRCPDHVNRLLEEATGALTEETGELTEASTPGDLVSAEELRQGAGTPQTIFEVLNEEYHFDVDVCAAAYNAKLPHWIGREENALATDWSCMRAWCNPPNNDIPSWLAKSGEPVLVAYLLPTRTDRMWWKKYKPLSECHYFVGEAPHRRLQFIPPPGVTYSSTPTLHCLMIFGGEISPGKEVWRSGKTGRRL